jgi:DNA-binding transcriptional MerR regulator
MLSVHETRGTSEDVLVEQSGHLSIGRFAGLTGISANTLRRYDKVGILSPACTDPETGYRQYSIEQLDAGIVVRLLRDLDVPLDDVKELVRDADLGGLKTVLVKHRERVVVRRDELERIVGRIDAVLRGERSLLPSEIELVTLAPVWVVSRGTTISREHLDETIESFLLELTAELAAHRATPTGREVVLYYNSLQWYRGLDFEVCLPAGRAVAEACGGRLLSGAQAMRTLYRGPWDDIWQEYAAMLAYIARSEYEVCGPVRETYVVDERDTDDPQRYVTEIAWPVRPLTAV